MKKVVISHRNVEEMTRSNAWRIFVVVFRPWSWDAHQSGSELSCWAWRWQRCRWSRVCAAAEQARLELLVGSEPAGSEIHRPTVRDGHCSCHQATVVSPIEAEPRPVFPRLVLYVSRLVELFVVIDAEWGDIASATPRRDSPGSSKLRVEEACCYARENEKSRESMEVGHTHPPGNGGNLGVMPFDRESEWSAPEHAEVIRIMGIFPDVLTGED